MTRLIDADMLYTDLVKMNDFGELSAKKAIRMVSKAPTVDALPVKHGKWIDPETFKRMWFRHHIFECSVCRNILDMDGVNAGRGDANYCPNCGARMDEEEE